MQRLKADQLLNWIRSSIGVCAFAREAGTTLDDRFKGDVLMNLRQLLSLCEELHLVVSVEHIRKPIEVINSRLGAALGTADLFAQVQTIARTVEIELASRLCFVIPGDNARYYSDEPLFGEKVDASFPSASPEIAEAGKCLSLGRHTAAVFHLMRSLEIGLRALAKPFGLTLDQANWNQIIELIEKEIRSISSATHGANWKEDERFYSEAAAHFRILKNAWRNHAMHSQERYDEERALAVFNSTKNFMQHLAIRLQE